MTLSIKGILLFLFILFFGFSKAQNASVNLELRNIEILKGKLFVSLTNDSLLFANFINPKETRIQKITVTSSIETLVFKNIEPGWYAIAVFQDLNANDILDTKRFGIPTEPFGFSNNALAKYKPPFFTEAKFYVSDNKQISQVIDLVYRKPKRDKIDTLKK